MNKLTFSSNENFLCEDVFKFLFSIRKLFFKNKIFIKNNNKKENKKKKNSIIKI